MNIEALRAVSPHTAAKIWVLAVLVALVGYFVASPASYMTLDAIGIWVLSSFALLYVSRKAARSLTTAGQVQVVVLGLAVCCLSFANIPLGLGNPPYSIGDFSILLAGIGLVIFGLLGYRSLLLPAAFPVIAVVGFEAYELFIRHQDWLSAPLIGPTAMLTVLLLNLTGIHTLPATGGEIAFLSLTGEPIHLVIIADCTGIWSLGTFTIAAILVLVSFPQGISRRGGMLVLVGYIGTYAANIVRVFLIAISGYVYGPIGVIEEAHIHIGWVIFSVWMVVYWYYFFTRHLGLSWRGPRQPEAT